MPPMARCERASRGPCRARCGGGGGGSGGRGGGREGWTTPACLVHRSLDRLHKGDQELLGERRRERGAAEDLRHGLREVGLARQLAELLREQLHLELVLLQLRVAEVDLLHQALYQIDECPFPIHAQ